MSPHQHRIRIRIPIHSRLQRLRQIFFKRRVLDDRHPKRIVKAQPTRLTSPLRDPFDLLDVADLEASVFAVQLLD